ncbi:MAG: hypothetical protein AAFQ36_09460 [Pseudomonadota bacterium]
MADPSKYPTRIAPYGLRMRPELKAALQEAADEGGRTLHAEIIVRLERSLISDDTSPQDIQELKAMLTRLNDQATQLTLEVDVLKKRVATKKA